MSLPSFEPGHPLQQIRGVAATDRTCEWFLRVRIRTYFETEYFEKRLRGLILWNALVLPAGPRGWWFRPFIPQKQTVSHLINKWRALHKIHIFIIVFTDCPPERHESNSLPWSREIHFNIVLPGPLLQSCFPINVCYVFLTTYTAVLSAPPILCLRPWLDRPANILRWSYKLRNSLLCNFRHFPCSSSLSVISFVLLKFKNNVPQGGDQIMKEFSLLWCNGELYRVYLNCLHKLQGWILDIKQEKHFITNILSAFSLRIL
jgi:hypothetical protein